MKPNYRYFECLSDFLKYAEQFRDDIAENFSDIRFTGDTLENTWKKARNGDTEAVPKAQAIIEKMFTEIETKRRQYTLNVAGAFPCVPAFVAGVPESMYSATNIETTSTPIRIFVGTTSSAAIDFELMNNRGIAILALVMKLNEMRPIELYQISTMASEENQKDGDNIILIRHQIQPLCLAESCFMLTSHAMERGIVYGAAKHSGFRTKWYSFFSDDTRENWKNLKAIICEMLSTTWNDESDILFPPCHIKGQKDIEDPIQYCNNILTKLNEAQ